MDAESILDRFTDEEVQELERYYLYTISQAGVRHDPITIVGLLRRLTVAERMCLSKWAAKSFEELPLPEAYRPAA